MAQDPHAAPDPSSPLLPNPVDDTEDWVEHLLAQRHDQAYGYASLPTQRYLETDSKSPKRRAGHAPAPSRKVSWSLREHDDTLVRAFGYRINPQGIHLQHTTRTQLTATKGSFHVDDFGQGPITITLRQLVAGGAFADGPIGDYERYTAREDVQRWLKGIYLPAVTPRTGKSPYKVYFHDNHFERGFEQLVYFPSQSFTVQRAVDLHNVWLVEMTMVCLEVNPYPNDIHVEARAPDQCNPNVGRRYVVKKRNDTIHRLATRMAGKGRTAKKVATIEKQLLKLNHGQKDGKITLPNLGKSRVKDVVVFIGGGAQGVGIKHIKLKRGQLFPGETIRIPC